MPAPRPMQNRDRPRPTVPDFTPVPRKRDRHDGWTPERQRAFLEALADSGSVKHAARSVRMSSEGAYYLRRQPGAEEFAAAWQAALDHGVRRLEDIALDRAINGVEVPVYSYGKLIGTRVVHNDRLLMFLLRNRAPERFGTDAMRKAAEPTPKQVEELRRQWEQEKAQQRAEEQKDMAPKIRAALAQVRERMMEGWTDEEREFDLWKDARMQGRAVMLPRKDGEDE
ncbi:MAG TPA: hypothetical protein VF503_10880 [Sphingobium sp.]|uniref:hypothetical protein n=1 Tax=Sphingobium sp. TaxID=1912891 RepID=UPI002ED2D3E4